MGPSGANPSVNKQPAAVSRVRLSPQQLESVMEDRWLSVDEIGAYLGIKRDTVYKWISEKSMPAHRMGRLWKFRKEEVDEWVKSGGAEDPRGKRAEQGGLL